MITKEQIKAALLDHRLFIGAIIAFTALVLGMLIYFQWFAGSNLPSVKEISIYPLDRPAVKFPIEFNVVKNSFSKSQQAILIKCADTWNKETKGIVQVQFNMDWEPPEPFDEKVYETYGQKTIWLGDVNKSGFLRLQLETNLMADAVSIGDFIVVMNTSDAATDNNELYIVVLHELGHQWGLEHIKPEYPALMNLTGNDGVISKYDMVEFCYLYGCKP